MPSTSPGNVLRWVLAMLAIAGACRGADEEPLRSIESIRTLPPAEIAAGRPVTLRGKLTTWTNDGCYLNGGGRCIFIDWHASDAAGCWKVRPPAKDQFQIGDLIDVTGVTHPGNYSPEVLPESFVRVGPDKLPEPRTVVLDRLLSGNADGQWVKLEGVIQEAAMTGNGREASLLLLTTGHPCRIHLWDASQSELDRMVDARVEVRGVFSPLVNLRKEMNGLGLFANDASNFEVLRAAPADPFQAPRVELGHLLSFAPKDFYPWHRRVTAGVISYSEPGKFFFMQEGDTGVRVNTADVTIRAGEQVEVSGFVTTTNTLAGLHGALVRKTGEGSLPEAKAVSSSLLLDAAGGGDEIGDFHGRRISLTGTLARIDRDAAEMVVLTMESEGITFPVRIPRATGAELPAWVIGSELKLTGTCDLNFNERPSVSRAIPVTGFGMWLISPADVVVMSKPSWWTPLRLWLVIGCVAGLLAAALVWVRLLQREVRVRGHRLAREITARQEARLQFEATLRERNLLAADLHDTLEQSLIGLSLQLQAASHFHGTDDGRSKHHLNVAETFLDRSREEMRRTVANLRDTGAAGGGDLVASLREMIAPLESGTDVRIEVTASGESFAFPEFVAANLRMLVQEAVTNALKHGKASVIRLQVAFQDEALMLEVADDGAGFDIATIAGPGQGHYGMQGMRERAKRLGAELEIESQPGRGSSIRVRMRKDVMLRSVASVEPFDEPKLG